MLGNDKWLKKNFWSKGEEKIGCGMVAYSFMLHSQGMFFGKVTFDQKLVSVTELCIWVTAF